MRSLPEDQGLVMNNGSVFPNRRTLLKTAGVGVAGLPFVSALRSASAPIAATAAPAPLLPAPPGQVEPLLDRAKVDKALARLDEFIDDTMGRTGLPGMAVAV